MLDPSKKLVYAVESVVDIAYNGGAEPVRSREIAKRQGVPHRYLEQVMQRLVHAGVLRGVRGPRGGYRLARERRRISVGEITRLVAEMEGNTDPLEEPVGSELGRAVLHPLWMELQEDAILKLDKVSIDELCARARARASGVECNSADQFDFMI